MKQSVRLATATVLLLAAMPAGADDHAIAMHGAPKYGPGFAHFDYVNPAAPKGGRLVLARTGSFDSLNPFLIKGVAAAGSDLVFERLLKRSRDEPFTLYGHIAESVSMPDDRSSVTFTLRPQARFHDGTPITVDDVIFSIETLRIKGRPNHRLYYALVARTEKLGPRTLRLIFGPGSNREMPLIMGLMPILSKRYYATVDFATTTLTPPLGSGPYTVAAVEPGRSITYQRVADYWGRDLPGNKGQYNFDRIRFDYYRDGVVALEAFKKGLVDLRPESDPGRWATGYDSPALTADKIILAEIDHGRPAGLYAFAFNTRQPIFADRRVRAALAYAFNFEWVNRTLFHDAYRRTVGYFDSSDLAAEGPPSEAEKALLAPFAATLPSEVMGPAYRPPSAADGDARRRLRTAFRRLRAAGWTSKDSALVTADGSPARFEILLLDPRQERLALEFRRRLGRLGITVSVRTVDSAQYQERLNTYDFDMILYQWDASLSPGNEQAFYWGTQAAGEEGTRNYPGIREPAIDAMIVRISDARDRPDLIAAARVLDRLLQWGHYTVPLFYLPKDRIAYWDRFGRPTPPPLYGYDLDTWWVDAAKAARLGR
jgi:microcin C transport system substrate-binding protein